MFCKQCGTQLDDKALFCKSCGAKTENAQQPVQQAQPVQQPVQQAQPVYQQPVYQQPVQQAQPVYAQQPVYQQPYVQQAAPKKSNGKLIAIILAAVAVVAAIAVALVLILGGGSGDPGAGTGGSGGESELTEAGGSKNNLDLGSAGTTNAMIGGLQNIVTANGTDFEFYFNDGYAESEIKGSVLFDLETGELTLDAEADIDGSSTTIAIYDGYVITGYEDEEWIVARKYEDEIPYQVEEILAMAEEYDFAGMVLSGETFVDLMKEAMAETMGDEELEMVEQMVSFDDLADAIDEFLGCLNDDSWLEDNLDEYSRTEKGDTVTISLEVSSLDFVNGIVDIFLPIIDFSVVEDMAGQSIDEDMIRDMLEAELDNISDDLDFLVALDLVITDDFVTDVEFVFEMDGEKVEIEAHLDNVGNPTIDEDKLADLLESADRRD